MRHSPRVDQLPETGRSRVALKPRSAPSSNHPLLQLQQSLGNRAVQRLLDGGLGEGYDPAASALVKQVLGSPGEELDSSVRAMMESQFGADFSGVRVHTNGLAAESAAGIAAHAYTSGQDIVFADGRYQPETAEGRELLAHELTHVVQQASGPVAGTLTPDGGLSISDPADEFEQAADRQRERFSNAVETPPTQVSDGVPVQRDDDDSWFGGVTSMISSAGSSIASGIGSVVDAGESLASNAVSAVSSGVSSAIDTGSALVSDAGSAIASGASTAWDAASTAAGKVGSAVVSGAESVESFAEKMPGPLGMPNPLRVAHGLYDVAANGADLGDTLNRTMNPLNYMREDAASIKSAEGSIDRGIDWLEDKGKGATHWLANQVSDVPVLGSLASAGESMVDTGIDFAGGVGKGLTGLGGGLATMAADPIDAAKGLYTMSEHIPGLGLPEKLLSGAYDLATTDKSFGQVANEALNPMEDLKYWGRVGSGILAPMGASIAAGKPGEAAGQAGVLIASLLGGEGEVAAAEEGSELSQGARIAEEAGTGLPVKPAPEVPITPAVEPVPEVPAASPVEPVPQGPTPKAVPEGPAAQPTPEAPAAEPPAKAPEHVDLTDAKGRQHILEGEGPGQGGHGPGRGKPGKSEFPGDWSDDRVLHEASDIATDPAQSWSPPDARGYRTTTKTVDGVDIKVVYDTRNGRIVTAFPTNLPRNPYPPSTP